MLLVDDDVVLRERMARALRVRGYEVRTAGSYDEGLALAEVDSPEYAVVDLRMPGRSGLELVRALQAIDESTRILILTGYGSISTAVDAIQSGAVNFIPKPADADEILAAFERVGEMRSKVSSEARARFIKKPISYSSVMPTPAKI